MCSCRESPFFNSKVAFKICNKEPKCFQALGAMYLERVFESQQPLIRLEGYQIEGTWLCTNSDGSLLPKETIEYYQLAAKAGNSEVLRLFARMLHEGVFFDKNVFEALQLYKRVVGDKYENCPIECAIIADIYRYGEGGVSKDINEAIKWYKYVDDDDLKWNNLGNLYKDELNYPEALKCYRKTDFGALHEYDELLASYLGFSDIYGYEYVMWFLDILNQDSSMLFIYLGDIYRYGKGVTLNFAESIKWYHMAAEMGNLLAYVNLGIMYELCSDFSKAIRWYCIAMQHGISIANLLKQKMGKTEDEIFTIIHDCTIHVNDEWAQYIWGNACLYGLTIQQNLNTAIKNLWQSLQHRNKYALYVLRSICLFRGKEFEEYTFSLNDALVSQILTDDKAPF